MVNRSALQDDCSGPEFAIGEMYAIRQFRVEEDSKNVSLHAVMQTAEWTPGLNIAKCSAKPTPISKDVFDALSLLDDEVLKSLGFVISATTVKRSEYANRLATQMAYYYHYSVGGGVSTNIYPTEEVDTGYYLAHNDSVVPRPDCTCGFYAYHDMAALKANAYDAEWVGIIRAHGRIVVGEKGLRAEKAEVVALVRRSLREERETIGYFPVKGTYYTSGGRVGNVTGISISTYPPMPAWLDSDTRKAVEKYNGSYGEYEHPADTEKKRRIQHQTEALKRRYPDVLFFDTIEQMLRQFPLTGADDFRDSTQN